VLASGIVKNEGLVTDTKRETLACCRGNAIKQFVLEINIVK